MRRPGKKCRPKRENCWVRAMKIGEKIIQNAQAKGIAVGSGLRFFSPFTKDERGIPRPNGKHRVKLLRDEIKIGKDPHTGLKRQEYWVYLEENGEEKIWTIPVFARRDDGTYDEKRLNYLIPVLSEFREGDWVIIEGIKKADKSYTNILPVEAEVDNNEGVEPIPPGLEGDILRDADTL